MVDDTRLLIYRTAFIQNEEIRYAADVESIGELRIVLRIDLEDDGLACHVCRSASDLWRCHAARPTPCRPEIYEYRNSGVIDGFIKQSRIGFERLIDRRQGGFASSAAACVCEVTRGNSVLSATSFANSNGRHKHLRSQSGLIQLTSGS